MDRKDVSREVDHSYDYILVCEDGQRKLEKLVRKLSRSRIPLTDTFLQFSPLFQEKSLTFSGVKLRSIAMLSGSISQVFSKGLRFKKLWHSYCCTFLERALSLSELTLKLEALGIRRFDTFSFLSRSLIVCAFFTLLMSPLYSQLPLECTILLLRQKITSVIRSLSSLRDSYSFFWLLYRNCEDTCV